METFEITRTGLQRQASIGPAPGAKVVPWVLTSVFLILTTGIVLLLTGTFFSYKRLSAEKSVFLNNNAEKLQNEQCEEKYCDSKDCIRMALRISELMNPKADPCSDFYEYACGGKSKPRRFPPRQHTHSFLSDLHFEILTKIRSILEEARLSNDESETFKKTKQLYRSCMDTEARKNATSQALVYWFSDLQLPLSSSESPGALELDSPGSWRKLVSRLEEFRIHTVVEPSFKSLSSDPIETIELNCVMPTFPFQTYLYPKENESMHHFRLYKTVMFNVLGKLKMTMIDKEEFYRDIIEMETEIATIMQRFHSSREKLSEEHTNQMRDIWRVMLGDIVQDINIVSVCKYNLDDVLSTLNSSPPKRAARYVIWRMLVQVLPFLGEDLQKLHKYFLSHRLEGTFVFDSTWTECTEFIRKELGLAVFKELTESGYIRKKTARDIKFLSFIGKGHLLQTLRNCNWMDSSSKEYLINKVKEIVFYPGFSELIFQTETSDIVYSDWKLEDNYFHSVMSIKKFKTRKSLDRLWYGNSENPISEISLDDNPLGFSSKYDYAKNVAHLDYGLLLPPSFFYTRFIPKYLKFGELSLLMREMSHVIDETGISRVNDDQQHLSNIQQKYNEYAECLLNQTDFFHSFPREEAFKHDFFNYVIADMGSFQFLYRGLISHLRNQQTNELKIPGIPLTKTQTYFVQVAQRYCDPTNQDSSNVNENNGITSRIRVNLAVLNMESFGNSFNCPRNKPPYTMCQLF